MESVRYVYVELVSGVLLCNCCRLSRLTRIMRGRVARRSKECIVIGAVRHTAPIKIGYVQFAFSQTEKLATQLKLT